MAEELVLKVTAATVEAVVTKNCSKNLLSMPYQQEKYYLRGVANAPAAIISSMQNSAAH